jgi:hypothetical protein
MGIDGMTLDGPLAIHVAALDVSVVAMFDDNTRVVVHPEVDTLVVDTEGRRVMLTARAAFPLGRGKRRLRALRVEPRRGGSG